MPKKPNRQQLRKKQAVRAARAAELVRRRRVRQRRLSVAGILAVIAAVGVVAIFLVRGNDTTDLATEPSTTKPSTTPSDATPSSEPAQASVAGKPCVELADPLPPGAPAVPVKVGPPPTQLVAEDLKPGTGAVVTADQTLKVSYIGVSCSTGKIFDSSYSRNEPAEFPLNGVIEGWQKGIPGMKVGGQRLLGIPPDLGYGDAGSPPDIAPGETLWFVVEVLDAKAA